MQKTMTIEISKVNNNENNVFEWTKTLKIDYNINNKTISHEENEMIKQEIEYRNKQLNKKEIKESSLVDSQILAMDGNPFHQPSMNTFEFSVGSNVVVHVENNDKTPLSMDEKIIALDKLLDEKIITKEEHKFQKAQLEQLKK